MEINSAVTIQMHRIHSFSYVIYLLLSFCEPILVLLAIVIGLGLDINEPLFIKARAEVQSGKTK